MSLICGSYPPNDFGESSEAKRVKKWRFRQGSTLVQQRNNLQLSSAGRAGLAPGWMVRTSLLLLSLVEHLFGKGIHASRGFTASHRAEDGDSGKKATLGHSKPRRVRRRLRTLGMI